jgi:hypothetical protein
MAFEDLLVALRDNQLGELWRQEPLQLADPPKFLDLLSAGVPITADNLPDDLAAMRNRWFADSPLERRGFEPLVPLVKRDGVFQDHPDRPPDPFSSARIN